MDQAVLDAHEMRITNHGKIQAWVDFALQFFEANEKKALVLHTLPAKGKEKPTSEPAVDVAMGESDLPVQAPFDAPAPKKNNDFASSTTTIPRLISVAEIIKREYLKQLDAKRAAEFSGLFQYNEMGCLEDDNGNADEDPVETAEDRARNVTEALSGTTHVKVKRSPYMKITLCRRELPDLAAKGATFQFPAKRKLSKSAKGRLKKRTKREAATDGATEARGESESQNEQQEDP